MALARKKAPSVEVSSCSTEIAKPYFVRPKARVLRDVVGVAIRIAYHLRVAAHVRFVQEQQQARSAMQLAHPVARFVLGHQAASFVEPPLHLGQVRVLGLERHADARRPPIDGEIRDRRPGVAARVGRVVPGAGGKQRPVEEMLERIVSVAVAVEHVRHCQAPERDAQVVAIAHPRQLVGLRANVHLTAAEADSLAQLEPRGIDHRRWIAHSIDEPARKRRHAQGAAQTLTAAELGVENQLAPRPQPAVGEQRRYEGGRRFGVRAQAVLARVLRRKLRVRLRPDRRLKVQAVALVIAIAARVIGARCARQQRAPDAQGDGPKPPNSTLHRHDAPYAAERQPRASSPKFRISKSADLPVKKSEWLLSSLARDVRLQRQRQVIEHQPHPPRRFEIAVHRHPNPQFEIDAPR